MVASKKTYKNPKAGQQLISTISSAFVTPILEVKFCNLIKPFYYQNSPTVPRYSVTCVFDPQDQKDFLKLIQTIEKNEGVDTILKNETEKSASGLINTGRILIKFQSKDIIPVYNKPLDEKLPTADPLELEDELAAGEKIYVVYDILRYTKKNTMKTDHGITFKPTSIFYCEKEGE